MGMRSTWWGEIYGRSRGDLGEIQGPPHLLRPRLEPELDARAGIMQPVKNGRTDMPSGVALLEVAPVRRGDDLGRTELPPLVTVERHFDHVAILRVLEAQRQRRVLLT